MHHQSDLFGIGSNNQGAPDSAGALGAIPARYQTRLTGRYFVPSGRKIIDVKSPFIVRYRATASRNRGSLNAHDSAADWLSAVGDHDPVHASLIGGTRHRR
jgi:hypothetical protein